MGWHVGVDIGGTFTDLLAWSDGGVIGAAKVPSTQANQAEGLLDALRESVPLDEIVDISEVLHGTTVATNAVLERTGARTALITTAGFRDILELGRRTRPDTYGLRGTFVPIVPRWHRYEVTERIDRNGNVLIAPNPSELTRLVEQLRRDAIESVAIVCLNSFRNPASEDAMRAALRASLPAVQVTTSADVLPEIGEFERTVVTVLNAYLQPKMSHYLGSLQRDLGMLAPNAAVHVMQLDGGTLPVAETLRLPVRTILGGPAAGVTGAARIAASLGLERCITCDMGGTSFDVSVVESGRPLVTRAYEMGYNLPIRLPALDIRTIGAGGGSIAWLDDGGLLRVGPGSAGSNPGPIWYGHGGTRFTVTDANVVLGRLHGRRFGTRPAATQSAEAIWEIVSSHDSALSAAFKRPKALADAVLRLVTSAMAGAVRDMTIKRGRDPREYALIAFGGAGPLHACDIARVLGIRKVIIPSAPGLLSAYGCLVADLSLDAYCSADAYLDELEAGSTKRTLEALSAGLVATLHQQNPSGIDVRYVYECQFDRQVHSLFIEHELGVSGVELERSFRQTYAASFGEHFPPARVLLTGVRVEAKGYRTLADEARLAGVWQSAAPEAYPRDGYWRPALREGDVIRGPVTISAPDASIFLPEEVVATVLEGHIEVEV